MKCHVLLVGMNSLSYIMFFDTAIRSIMFSWPGLPFTMYLVRMWDQMLADLLRDFLTYPSIQDHDIPMFIRQWQNWSHMAARWDKCCCIWDNLHATFDVMMFQIIRCQFSTFVTLACATTIQNFKCLYLLYVWIKISSVGMHFVSLKIEQKEHFGTKIVWFCWNFLFRSFTSDTFMFKTRKGVIRKTTCWWYHGYVRKGIDHRCSVSTGNSQPSGPPFQWETWRASFHTGTVDAHWYFPVLTEHQWWMLFVPNILSNDFLLELADKFLNPVEKNIYTCTSNSLFFFCLFSSFLLSLCS